MSGSQHGAAGVLITSLACDGANLGAYSGRDSRYTKLLWGKPTRPHRSKKNTEVKLPTSIVVYNKSKEAKEPTETIEKDAEEVSELTQNMKKEANEVDESTTVIKKGTNEAEKPTEGVEKNGC